MHFTAATVLAFAASALAQTLHFDAITKPGQSETIPAGSKYTIQWEPSTEYSGTVSLSVIGGASPATLQPVGDIAKNVDNSLGTYDWAVPSTFGSLAVYGIQITLDSNSSIFQYSFPFAISGGSNDTTESSSASASATATTSAGAKSSAASTTTEDSSAASTTSAPIGNLSTTATDAPKTTITSVFTQTPSTVASKTSSVPTVPTNAAATLAVGPIAMLGALAAAAFAL